MRSSSLNAPVAAPWWSFSRTTSPGTAPAVTRPWSTPEKIMAVGNGVRHHPLTRETSAPSTANQRIGSSGG